MTTAKYTPPAPSQGTVEISMGEVEAQKLMALLGRTTGSHFDDLYRALRGSLPDKDRLRLTIGPSGNENVYLQADEGASFKPFHS